MLNQMAIEVNQVWNKANELTSYSYYMPIPEVGYIKTGLWLSTFDVNKSFTGYTKNKNLLITSASIQEIIAKHSDARSSFKRSKLRWRKSTGSNRSLGWVPFRVKQLNIKNGILKFGRIEISVFDSYGLTDYQFKSGSFSEDSKGLWYLNVCVEQEVKETIATTSIGIDLGLKTVATCSDGQKLEASKNYRALEEKLGIAQRSNNKKRVKAIHAKIKNKRKDELHKFSTQLVEKHAAIFVGDVSSTKLAKTKMAKSVLDSGWGMLKTMLKYKADARSVLFEIIDERYTTQECSSCNSKDGNNLRGMGSLGIREWTCALCGAEHDRDINSSINILERGHALLAGGIKRL